MWMNKFDKEISMSDSFNPQFTNELDDNFIPSRQEIQRILREEERLVEGSDGMEHLAVEVPDVFTDVAEAISNGDCNVMPVGETDEYVINSREDYDAAITKIKAHFDDEDKCGEYDIASSLEEEKQYHKASRAYIKYLEETLANTQSLVIAYGEKITEQKDSLLNMCARLGKM